VFNTVRFGTMFSTAVLASVWMFERARGVEFTAPPPRTANGPLRPICTRAEPYRPTDREFVERRV
jgi:hypothetical protein